MTVPRINERRAAALLAELQRRKAAAEIPARLLGYCFEAQRRFILDPSRRKAALCTRRAGKSVGCAVYMLYEAFQNPHSVSVFIGLTRDSAKRIIWDPGFKKIDRELRLGLDFNNSELSIRLPNGALIYLIGLDATEEQRNKVLGQAFRLAVIDESGSFTTDLADLVRRVLVPALRDHRGTLALIGTPETQRNFFFTVTNPDKPLPGWSVHRWSSFDNPHTAEQTREEIAEIERLTPEVKELPWYQQHYLGLWSTDLDQLVYRFDPQRNYASELPDDGREWHHVVGIDIGWNDESAWVVCAYGDHDPTLYVVHASKQGGMLAGQIARRTQELVDRYDAEGAVVDPANKNVVEEIRLRLNVPVELAQKTDKERHAGLMTNDLVLGAVKVLEGPETQPLVDEWTGLVWRERDRGGRKVREMVGSRGDHCADACLYAWRDSMNYLAQPEPASPPGPNDPGWMDSRVEEYAAGLRAKRDTPWWAGGSGE